MSCIFCGIVGGDVPSHKIFENEHVLAFLDIAKDVEGHTLVVPKKHFKNLLDCDDATLCEVAKALKEITNHYVKNCGFEGANILQANDESAGQSVFHLHFHIIPRKKDDGLDAWPKFNGTSVSLEETCKRLKLNNKES